jgi:hypothetical protein
MKTPAELATRWVSQWENPDLRESRLLDGGTAWPAQLPIGRPSASDISVKWEETAAVLQLWREVRAGRVRWEPVPYRATGAPVQIPVAWEISNPEEWAAASGNKSVRSECDALNRILKGADSIFHSALIRERSLWRNKTVSEVIQASALAMELAPGCARRMPLRAMSLAGIDSKFFERHRSLIIRFLDLRFDGEAGRQGLETFLDAWLEADHWLLIADLGSPGILPFSQLRARSVDLATARLSPRALLIVENEKCLHLLPGEMPGVIAILGAGNNLSWLGAPWGRAIPVGYWGDIDTWGLTLLARAREIAPHLQPLLMTREVFEACAASAVIEKTPASALAPVNLTDIERSLYLHLLGCAHGRLEQEFISTALVHAQIRKWAQPSR